MSVPSLSPVASTAVAISSRAARFGRQVGREPALVPQPGGQALLLQHRLERVVDPGALLHGVAEGRRPDRGDHELLDVDVGVRVRTAVDDVHHRHRQQVGVRPADVAVERQVGGVGGRVGHGQRDAEDRVGADLALVVGAVEVEHRLVHQPLLAGLVAHQLRTELVDHPQHGLADALAAVPAVAVAQLDRLERPRGRARRDRGAALGSVVEDDLHLDRGVAAGVEDLASADELDTGHLETPFAEPCRMVAPADYRRGVRPTDQAGGCVAEFADVARRPAGAGAAAMAAATFTPTMPAQETRTPTIPGSTTLALIAVMGMPTPSEMMPSTNRWVRDSARPWPPGRPARPPAAGRRPASGPAG